MELRRQINAVTVVAMLVLPALLLAAMVAERELRHAGAAIAAAEALTAKATQLRLLGVEMALFHEARARDQWQRNVAAMEHDLAANGAIRAEELAKLARIAKELQLARAILPRLAAHAGQPVDSAYEARAIASLTLITQAIMDTCGELIEINRDASTGALNRLKLALVALIAAMGGLVAFMSLLVKRQVLKPVGVLLGATALISEGNFKQRLAMPQRNEIGRLGAAFDAMAERLQQARRQQDSFNSSLQQSAARTEAALRESAALLSTLDKHAIVSIANAAGTIVEVNDAFCAISAYTREELIGNNHRIINSGVHPADFWRDAWATFSSGVSWRSDVCNRAKDGTLYWVDTIIAPFLDEQGRILKYVSIRRDISASKKAEAALQRSEQLLRGAIDAIDEAFVLYDPEDRLVFCNEKYRELYHSSRDLLVEGNQFETIIRVGAERGQFATAIGGVESWVRERMAAHLSGAADLIQRLADGRTLRIVERRMPDGHIVGFRIDITALVQATDSAQAASRAKSEFLANLSHELRTPMNAVLGMLTLLGRTELTARQLDYARKADSAARALLSLLNEVLDFSKIEAGKMELESQVFELDAVLSDLSVIFSSSTECKDVEVLFELGADLPRRLLGDPMRLKQVLINLGGNALKFTDTGEVVLSVHLRGWHDDKARLEFAVRDTGIGIAPAHLERIFELFTQAEASITRRFGGTGLGVAISARLVALMGGNLEVQSELGRGSRFHFCIELPVQGSPAKPPERTAPAWRVLVVDDHPTARTLIAQLALGLGWQVDPAEQGEQALAMLDAAALREQPYQTVFLDWRMPGLDGWQVAERIRRRVGIDEVPIVVMVSAYGREVLEQRSDHDHALLDGFLVKPVTMSMLADAVNQARAKRPSPAPLSGANRKKQLEGMRVLVVEDNLNNQQVVRELLEDEGALTALAEHGQHALDTLIGGATFDVLLMDLQMPVMDGYTATRHIRQQLGMTALPIVAMSANAMAEDRAACLQAGMDEHIGKPFELQHLIDVLCRVCGRAPPFAVPVPPVPFLAPATVVAAEAAGISLQGALMRLGGKQEVYRRMLANFITELEGMPEQLGALAARADHDGVHLSLHSLKGVAATLGADALAASAALAEQHYRDAPAPAARAQALAAACRAMREAGPGLRVLLDTLPAPAAAATPGLTRERRLALLRQAAGQLAASDMAVHATLAAITEGMVEAPDPVLVPLVQAVEALDFAAAAPLCHTLIMRYSHE
ncbi:MAG: response regulator [Telluria sp.]